MPDGDERRPKLGAAEIAATFRRGLSDAPAQLADGFAKVVRDSPERRLNQVMRTPARRVVLESIFWQMPKHLDRERASGVQAAVRWCITGRGDGGADVFDVEIEDGSARVRRGGGASEPRVTITVDGAEFLRLASGNSDPMQAYFKRRLVIAGDIMLAAKIVSLFRIPPGPERGP